MAEIKSTLTNHRYGGHSGVSDDHGKREYAQAMPGHLDNSPDPIYDPCGTTEPDGIEQHGMYGTAPRDEPPLAPLTDTTRPVPGPAALGQYDNADMDPITPQTDMQRLEVLNERLAQWIDPGTVRVVFTRGRQIDVCVLRGIVRDEAMRDRVARVALECLPEYGIRNELECSALGG